MKIMKKIWLGALGLVLLSAGIVWGLWSMWQQHVPKQSVGADQSKIVISEWQVAIPRSVFGGIDVRGYMVGPLSQQPAGESKTQGLVLLDQPLAVIEKDLGSETIAHAKQCLAYYRGLYRQPPAPWNEATTTDLPPALVTSNGFEYRSMVPQATCKTDPTDNSLDDFDSHVISGLDTDSIGKSLIQQ